ncbi:hypothetical protein [Streptomyces sp. NRRL B-3229]|uniref:hypothetical protein n=1 Tax=Streptomyces sp. NRRL B-3229 TaxID=1463836 RepID=UPI0004C0D33B|nr:hypothetical protein [Streptomyces sp. NRRL B-3229]
MAPDDRTPATAPAAHSGGYGRAVLADGSRPYLHRSGVRALLGVPDDTGVAVSFTPAAQGRSFPYVREHSGDPEAPSGWDDLLSRPATPEMPARWPEPTQTPADATSSPRTGSREPVSKAVERPERESQARVTGWSVEAQPATVPPRDEQPATVPPRHSQPAAAPPGDTRPDVTGYPPPVPPVVAELVVPGETLRPGEAANRSRARAPRTPSRASGAQTQGNITPPEPSSQPIEAAASPLRPAERRPTTGWSGAEVAAEGHGVRPPAPADEPWNGPARGPGYRPTPPSGRPVVSVPSRAPRDRRLAEDPVAVAAQLPSIEDSFTRQAVITPRRPAAPPYRTVTAPAPSATAPRQVTDPTPLAQTAPPTPAPIPPAPQPQVVVVRAPAATGAAAFWERRHHGRLRNGVVR